MRRVISVMLIILFSLSMTACDKGGDAISDSGNEADTEKLTAVATLFPQYDFARIVGGEKVEVIKLLPNGVESHSYEPTPSDVIAINDADFFIYTGDNMEPWAATIIDGISSEEISVVDVCQKVPLLETGGHDHEGEVEADEYTADPHIWTDPTRAMIMVDNIAAAFAAKDPENSDYYESNAEAYKEELRALDNEIQDIVVNGKRDKLIFGGMFAFTYFCDHYGLEYDAAIDSCSEHGEASAKKVAELIDEIEEEDIPIIYYEELRNPTVAQSIADSTGVEMLLFHSCHNVTDAEIEAGVSYLSLMEQNAVNLKKGLN